MHINKIKWRKLDHLQSAISTSEFSGETLLHVDRSALKRFSEGSVSRYFSFSSFGTSQPTAVNSSDSEASSNDRFVALDLLRNSQIAAEGILPMCQDTGTAIVLGEERSVSVDQWG